MSDIEEQKKLTNGIGWGQAIGPISEKVRKIIKVSHITKGRKAIRPVSEKIKKIIKKK